MKLWMRVYLLALPLALLVLVACAVRLMSASHQSMMRREYERALGDHAMLLTALGSHLSAIEQDFSHDASLTSAALNAAVRNYARHYTGNDVALAVRDAGDALLFSGMDERAGQAMALDPSLGTRQYVMRQMDDRSLLFVSGWIEVGGRPFRVDYMRDISAAIGDIHSFARQVSMMILAASLVLGVGLYLSIGAAMRPFGALIHKARAMARGDYAGRIAQLPGEVGELARAYNDMAGAVQQRIEQLERSARDRDAFIANLAHEMKTPMTTILGYADLLKRAKLSDEQRVQALDGILSEGGRLDQLSQKLLRLFGIAAGEAIDAAETDIAALFERVRASLILKLEQAQVSLRVVCAPGTRVLDAGLMQLMLMNLVENAIKASAPGDAVEMGYDGHAFYVADSGCGIPEAELTRVCQPFYMVDKQRARRQHGAGLGLTLAEAIASAHGARLTIESALGEGTTIRVAF